LCAARAAHAALHHDEVAAAVEAPSVRAEEVRECDSGVSARSERGVQATAQASDGEELPWFFRQRREATRQPAFVTDARYLEAAKQFSAPRFTVLEKVWRLHGDDVIWNTYSKGIEDQFEIGRAAVEFIVIRRQCLHLAHLVGVA
jgi:hypothetical protein